MDKMTFLMPWMNGYVASVDMAKHIPSPDAHKGTVERFTELKRVLASRTSKTPHRGA